MVQGKFDTARKGINEDFAAAGKGGEAYATQAFAQSGSLYDTTRREDTILTAASNLETERRKAMRNLDFSEAEAGLSQFNSLMQLLGAGAGVGLNLGSGFSSAQTQAISGLSNQSSGWGAVGGAASGAALGSQIYPGWGTAIGAVLGAGAGYLGSG
jgi:hypothetical protein